MPARARWVMVDAPDAAEVKAFASEFGVAPMVAAIAMQRGFTDRDALARFFHPRLKDLGDPFDLPNMTAAIERISEAIDRRENLLLYGDYDVDGVSSLALLSQLLQAYGLKPRTFLPQRSEEGYGLSREGLEKCLQEDPPPHLVIAADCGTNSQAEAALLKERGIDLIIIDHHEPSPGGVADCVAVVNPKLGDALHYLCTGGLIFKVAHALLKHRPNPDFDLRPHLDLVALATVADIVPLVEENRIFVRRGLTEIERTAKPGLIELKTIAGVTSPVRSHDIGFKLGPRLNATGRLDTAEASLELLLTPDFNRARTLAAELDRRNRERQTLEQDTREEAEAQILSLSSEERATGIVVGGRGWHTGVVGIVASRIVKQYHRPTFVIGFDENGMGKGSGRSVPGLSLIEAIAACRDLLVNGGGHEMAAGLSIREENLFAFRQRFAEHMAVAAAGGELQPRLLIDAELSFRDIGLDLLESYEMLRPFGNSNPQPVFMSRQVQVLAEPRVLKEKHLKLRLAQDGATRDAMYFSGVDQELPKPPWDIAYTIDRNEFRGSVSVTISIQAVRKATAR
ncbi:MAG: single-stranded-DNA-specific exonuclease RecJ [Verrucomicrobiae bacterium]|nr:single-stranded-DNA-specific exonuclease RecJ [Verrucomicrobiae bacterium]